MTGGGTLGATSAGTISADRLAAWADAISRSSAVTLLMSRSRASRETTPASANSAIRCRIDSSARCDDCAVGRAGQLQTGHSGPIRGVPQRRQRSTRGASALALPREFRRSRTTARIPIAANAAGISRQTASTSSIGDTPRGMAGQGITAQAGFANKYNAAGRARDDHHPSAGGPKPPLHLRARPDCNRLNQRKEHRSGAPQG